LAYGFSLRRLVGYSALNDDFDGLAFGKFDSIINHYDALMNSSGQFSLFVQHKLPPWGF
jgi:hypothetical protein